ncbi:MAG TPA: hypothetical protein V6D17_12505 [Candidatus Obscuribacterales bacterium]
MTRSLRYMDKNEPKKRKKSETPNEKSLKKNVLMLIGSIVFLGMWVHWTLADVTGEYTSSGYDSEVVRLSLVRRATNVKCELSWGYGAIMEATVNEIKPDEELNIVFHVPEKWLQRNQDDRSVVLEGRFFGSQMDMGHFAFRDNEIDARLIEGNHVYKVRLVRNRISSIYRQIQAHLPWLG